MPSEKERSKEVEPGGNFDAFLKHCTACACLLPPPPIPAPKTAGPNFLPLGSPSVRVVRRKTLRRSTSALWTVSGHHSQLIHLSALRHPPPPPAPCYAFNTYRDYANNIPFFSWTHLLSYRIFLP